MPALDGELSLRAGLGSGGRTALTHQAFSAPFHISKPYWDPDAATLVLQVVNPTAGILAGDVLSSEVSVGPGASLLLTTPSACRVFTMQRDSARSEQRFVVEEAAWLEVWPEPIVPHRGSAFHQATRLCVRRRGATLYADLLSVGRAAYGEAWAWNRLRLELEVEVDGELTLCERFRDTGEQLRALARLAGAGDSVAFGNAVFVPPMETIDSGWRDALNALQREGVWVGVSQLRVPRAWSIKFVAADGILLRSTWRAIRDVLKPLIPQLRADPRKL